MTDKQKKILATALEFFANQGYNAVSTSKIAKKAQVSEGLIFRHFKNKKGLLDALVQEAQRKLNEVLSHIIFETEPKQVLQKAIEFPFNINESEYNFWRLQFMLKWEAAYNKPEKMKPLVDKLSWAFSELACANPKQEAQVLVHLMDGIALSILRDGRKDLLDYKHFLLQKYSKY